MKEFDFDKDVSQKPELAEPIFCRTPPSGCLSALLERKRMKEMKWCVFTALSLTFFIVARFSWGNKNK